MTAALSVMVCVLLAVAGVTDWRSRTIPDIIPASVLTLGVLGLAADFTSERLLWAALGLAVPSVLIVAGHFLGHKVGGGDLKITAATGFFFGLGGLGAILILALIGGAVYCAVKRQSSIPFATFLAPAAMLWLGFTCAL